MHRARYTTDNHSDVYGLHVHKYSCCVFTSCSLCIRVRGFVHLQYITHFFLNSIQKMLGVIVTFDARPTLTSQRVKVPKAISLLDMTSSQGFRSLGFPMIKKYWSVQKIGECRNTLQKRHLNRKKKMISQTIGVQYFQTNTSHGFP